MIVQPQLIANGPNNLPSPEQNEQNKSEADERSMVIGSSILHLHKVSNPDDIFAQAQQLDNELNAWRKSSLWNQGGEGTLTPHQKQLFTHCQQWHTTSQGIIDPTIRPLAMLWWQAVSHQKVPSDALLEKAQKRLGFNKVSLTDHNISIPTGIQLDFGALRKGYLLDQIPLNEHSLINYGGSSWRVGKETSISVRDPLDPQQIWKNITVPAGHALAVSGGVQRSMRIGTKSFSQLIDPRSGRAIPADRAAVIIAPTALAADAYSSWACIAPDEVSLIDAWGWVLADGAWKTVGTHPNL